MKTPDLNDEAKAIWDHVTQTHPHLIDADSIPLARYCRLGALWLRHIADVEASGLTAVSEKGNEYMTAAASAVLGMGQQLIRLERELGIVSSTRPAGAESPGSLGAGCRKSIGGAAGGSLRGLKITG